MYSVCFTIVPVHSTSDDLALEPHGLVFLVDAGDGPGGVDVPVLADDARRVRRHCKEEAKVFY